MTDIVKLTVTLTSVSLAAGVAIAFTNAKTQETIAQRRAEAQESALRAVFPEGVTIEEQRGDGALPERYWRGSRNDTVAGYAFQARNWGYSSHIGFMVGVAPDGTILGMRVTSQGETPGLGTRVSEVVSKKLLWNGLLGPKENTPPWFTEQFVGLNAARQIGIDKMQEWHGCNAEGRARLREANSVTAITGATISTRAVSSAVEKDLSRYVRALRARASEASPPVEGNSGETPGGDMTSPNSQDVE